jgi:hypothetical protein
MVIILEICVDGLGAHIFVLNQLKIHDAIYES